MDQGSLIGVRVVGESTSGMTEGMGGTVRLTDVLQQEVLNQGDMVVTSGKDGIYPDGLMIGEVVELTGSQADITKGADIDWLATNEGMVIVVRGGGLEPDLP